jgi:hypothetical protein
MFLEALQWRRMTWRRHRNKCRGAGVPFVRQEAQLLQKFKYVDIVAIALVILFAGIPTVVALAS